MLVVYMGYWLVNIFFVKLKPIFQKPLVNTMHRLREHLQTQLLRQHGQRIQEAIRYVKVKIFIQ